MKPTGFISTNLHRRNYNMKQVSGLLIFGISAKSSCFFCSNKDFS
jgi:hypothetical protein